MKGGISYTLKRYSKIDKNKTIMYWDTNNLYGWAMSQSLPVSDFKFLTEKKINNFDLDSVTENSQTGYILECDLKYPKELHELHNDYPLCPEKIEVNSDMLSKYCSDIAHKYGTKVGGVRKLIPNLGEKVKYVVHYKNLQYYLSLGMKLVKIHEILKFKPGDWLKEYVDFNTKKRIILKNAFEVQFFKLLRNCVYGKSMENIRKRTHIKLINDQKISQMCK